MPLLEPAELRRSPRPPRWRRSNPFATRFTRPGALPFVLPDDSELCELMQRFSQQRQAAIVGPHGAGKTTLLQALLPMLRQRHPNVHLWRLSSSDRWPATLLAQVARSRSEGLLIIDGFEQIPWLLRFAITRFLRLRGAALLVTSHSEVPGVATLFSSVVSHAVAERLTSQLLAQYDDCEPVMMACFQRHWQSGQRNLRDLWFAMYDDFERLRPTRGVRSN